MTAGTIQMKWAVGTFTIPAGTRLRSTGVSKTLPKGNSHAISLKCDCETLYLGIFWYLHMWLFSNCFFSFRINIMNSNLEGVVLDNRYYAGSCMPHYIQDVRFRKPYNLQQYTLQVTLANECRFSVEWWLGSWHCHLTATQSYCRFDPDLGQQEKLLIQIFPWVIYTSKDSSLLKKDSEMFQKC